MESLTLLLVKLLSPLFRPISRWLLSKKRTYETWAYEASAIGILLLLAASITTDWHTLHLLTWETGKPVLANWLAVIAVLGSFLQAQVGFRMAEAQLDQEKPSVYCHIWATKYWLLKELTWAMVFLLTGAFSALVGNAVFIIYPAWRIIHQETRKVTRKTQNSS